MSATAAERHVSLYTILVDGSEIDEDLSRRIREVRIQNHLRLPDTCTLAATFPKAEAGQSEPIDQSPFDIGGSLEIRLGARDELTTSTVFKGEIVTLEPRWRAGGVELAVRAYDHSHVLMRSRKVRTFQNQTSSDIVSKLLTEAGFQAQCDPSGEPHEFVQQNNETDWELIWRLADRSGLELVIDGQTGIAAQTDRRERDRARVADVASVVQPSRHRGATGRRGDAAHSGPQDQAGDRRQRLDPSAGRADRRRPADRRGCVRVGQDAHRDGTGQEPGGGHVRCPGKARPARERLRRDRGVDVGQPEDQGGRERQDHRRRRAVQRHLPRRQRHSHIPRRKHLRDLVRERAARHPARGDRVGPWRRAAELRQPARARHRDQQSGPRQHGPGAGPISGARGTTPRGRGRESPRSAPATSGAR